MASFGWKRKAGEKVSKSTVQHFVAETEKAEEEGPDQEEDVDWLQVTKKRREVLLEDCGAQSRRLKDEGAQLAEQGRWAVQVVTLRIKIIRQDRNGELQACGIDNLPLEGAVVHITLL